MDPTASNCQAPRDIASVLMRFARMVKLSLRSHHLTRHGIDEDDVEQEIRIRLWNALERDPGKDFPAAYVQKVVFSAVIDAVRRERVRRRDLQSEVDVCDGEHPDQSRQPDSVLAQGQWADHLRYSLGKLPVRRRRPVQLFLLGYTLQEIADRCGLTLDAGSKLVRRGLGDLRRLLREHRSPD
jgi:RNA polymerase sigma-70 factor (ECF subfamily)